MRALASAPFNDVRVALASLAGIVDIVEDSDEGATDDDEGCVETVANSEQLIGRCDFELRSDRLIWHTTNLHRSHSTASSALRLQWSCPSFNRPLLLSPRKYGPWKWCVHCFQVRSPELIR